MWESCKFGREKTSSDRSCVFISKYITSKDLYPTCGGIYDRAVGVSRSLIQYQAVKREDESALQTEIINLATLHGRYGYKRITDMLKNKGFVVNHKRVYRIWTELGLKVPKKHNVKGKIYDENSCIRIRPEHRNHIWAYDFVTDKLSNGRKVRWLNIVDEYTRECLASIPLKTFTHKEVQMVLNDLFITKGFPKYIRSDNGSEFKAKNLLKWFAKIDVTPLFIAPGSPWENGYCESFNGKMRDEFLNMEIFNTTGTL